MTDLVVRRYGIAGKTRVLGYEEHLGDKILRRYRTPAGEYVTVDAWPEDESWDGRDA